MDRRIVQIASAALMNGWLPGWLTGRLYRGPFKAVCVPGLNCYSCPGALGACPVGAWQGAWSGAAARLPLYVTGLLLLFALTFGRAVCGWLCPFGLAQDALYRAPVPKLGRRRWMRPLTRLRWAILALVVLGPPLAWALTGVGKPFFCAYVCPSGTLLGALPLSILEPRLFQAAGWLTVWKGALLAVLLALAAAVYRPFCRFLCPLGLWYGFWNRRALFGVAVDAARCVRCGKCATVCPMDARIAGDAHCISCGRCLPSCPASAIDFRRVFAFGAPRETDRRMTK